MESNHIAQRLLIVMSLLVLGITGATWWWVASEPDPVLEMTAQANLAPPPKPAETTPSAVLSGPTLSQPDPGSDADPGSDLGLESAAQSDQPAPTEVGDAGILRLAGFEQTPEPASLPPTASLPPAGIPVPEVGVQVPAANATLATIKYNGVLAFVNDVRVVAQADGVIREFLVDEGSIVEKDKIMLEIDNRLARAEEEVARKELESAQLKADDESQINFAIASEEVARADYNRKEDLYKREVANIDEFERSRLEWIKSRFSIDVSRREKKINEAAVGVSLAKLNASGVQVELRTIRAPFTGIVAKTERENFEWVKSGDEILRLVSLEKFRVRGRVQINDSPNILERAPAKVLVQIQPGQVEQVTGTVGFVEPETSVGLDGKNEYGVWVEIENRIVNGQLLFRGKMNATVEIYPNR